jgi:hypothetical protein
LRIQIQHLYTCYKWPTMFRQSFVDSEISSDEWWDPSCHTRNVTKYHCMHIQEVSSMTCFVTLMHFLCVNKVATSSSTRI